MKKTIALAIAMMMVGTVSYGETAPGEWKVNAGMWDTGIKIGNVHFSGKWNLFGGLEYGLQDKLSVRFDHYGLGNKNSTGHSDELNALYHILPEVSLFAGYHIISSSDLPEAFFGKTDNSNHVVQLGFVADRKVNEDIDVYLKGAKGSKDTLLLEVGATYDVEKDLAVNAGYRYLNTRGNGDKDISYKGFLAGLSYRFGGGSDKVSEEPSFDYEYEPVVKREAPVYHEPAPEEVPAVSSHEVIEEKDITDVTIKETKKKENDYYLSSIHFHSGSDVFDTTQLSALDEMVKKAKETGHHFKLVGYTSAETDSDLAISRVKAIASYAVSKGVDIEQMVGMYKDESHLSDAVDQETSEKHKNRVDIFEHK